MPSPCRQNKSKHLIVAHKALQGSQLTGTVRLLDNMCLCCFHTAMAALECGATETAWCSKTEIFAVWLFIFQEKQAPSCYIRSSRYHLPPVAGKRQHLTSTASRPCHPHGVQQAKLRDFVTAQWTWVGSRLTLAICTRSQWTLAGVGWDRVTGPPRHGGCWPCNYLLEGKYI